MDTEELLEKVDNYDITAYGLLLEANPSFERRFKRIDKELIALLKDVQKHFPDARYYTASGGFHLILGDVHTNGMPNNHLSALNGKAKIGDGDW